MIDLTQGNYLKNAKLLLNGFWYAELPDLLDMAELEEAIEDIFTGIENNEVRTFKKSADDFIDDFSGIVSPPYIRSPGVEAISFFDFKKNRSLREMQIPNLVHYFAFMYDTLLCFSTLFEGLYINPTNSRYVANSNSYLVFKDEFVLHSYFGEEQTVSAGVFTTKNNKISTSVALAENRKRYLATEADYLYSLKMDIESFFPNLYTHNFEKMADKSPFSNLGVDIRYFRFLDHFHQRINNNQTKGIPAGIFSSHIAAELCMLCVDEEIRAYLETRKNPIGYIRYVDDLNFFSDSESELAELYPIIQSILNKYRLRINGNKTEAIHAVYGLQPAYIAEILHEIPILDEAEGQPSITASDYYLIKRYVGNCLNDKRSSQIRALLTLLHRQISEDIISIEEISKDLFYYLLKLVFEDVSLTAHIYRLLDLILEREENRAELLVSLRRKEAKIDAEYPDTILQIWHYYVLFRYSSDEERMKMVKSLRTKHFNPLVASTMVLPGKKKNKELYSIILEAYKAEAGETGWQSTIMNSRWWLPLFKISRYDAHNYDHFMQSSNFPTLLKMFSSHEEAEESEINT